jgi:hypothetical protein
MKKGRKEGRMKDNEKLTTVALPPVPKVGRMWEMEAAFQPSIIDGCPHFLVSDLIL